MNERNLVITGMMGTGKSSVARIAAKTMRRALVDTDTELEKRFGKKIVDIFQEDGEAAFRSAELALCEELSRKQGLVLSTGGGFLLPPRSLKIMNQHAIFCLDAKASTIAERTRHRKHRPLLFGVSDEDAIQQILNDRQGAYQNIFHHTPTDDRSIQEISDEIIRRYEIHNEIISEVVQFIRMPLSAPYPIVVKEGVIGELEKWLSWAGISAPKIIIVSNEKLYSIYGGKLSVGLEIAGHVEWLLIPEGEQHKNLNTVHRIYKDLLKLKVKRDDIIVAFGGGVVGDIAGFAAATYMRGLRFIQIPTTLLAMVDSSIGGKTGVDLEEGKNLVGAFKQPLMVLADPSVLQSLPKEEFSSGMAEVVKHALIGDPTLFEQLYAEADLGPKDIIVKALLVKAKIVENDPFEHGRRALLNLGHTFGHAIEKVSDYSMCHGYAVAIGMLAACELAFQLNECDAHLRGRLEKVLKRFELPVNVSGMTSSAILQAMRHDKKNKANQMNFILPCAVGDVSLFPVNEVSLVTHAIESVLTK